MTENYDHDLLIRVDENVKNLINDVKDMRDNVSSRLNEQTSRLEKLENWQSWSKGIFFLAGVLVSLVVYIYLADINGIKNELKKHEETTMQLLK